MGIPDRFFEHGKREILLKEAGLTPEMMVEAVRNLLERKPIHVR